MTRRAPLEELLRLDDGDGPAAPIDPARAEALVDGALDAVLGAGRHAPRPPRRRSSPRRKVVWAASALLVAGAAVAAMVGLPGREPAPPPSPSPRPAVVPLAPPDAAPPAADAAPAPPAPDRPPAADRRPASTEELLQRANRQRGQRRWKAAEATYLEAARREPRSATAQIARVAAGSIRLEHLGDAAGARRLFREALRLRGPVAEEARWGLCEAARRLGDRRGELAALRAFLAKHPQSMQKREAERRLQEAAKSR